MAQKKLANSLLDKAGIEKGCLLEKMISAQVRSGLKNDTIHQLSDLELSKKDCRYYLSGKIYSGIYYEADTLQNKIRIGKIGNGKKIKYYYEFNINPGKTIRLMQLEQVNSKYIEWRFYKNGNLGAVVPYDEIHNCVLFERLFGGSNADGNCYVFYENGRLRSRSSLRYGSYSGEYFHYYDNGKPKQKSYFLNKEMTGVWKQYNRKGRCTARIIYKNGKVIETKGEWKKWSELN